MTSEKTKIKNESRSFIVIYEGDPLVITINSTSLIEQYTGGFRLSTTIDTGRGYRIIKNYSFNYNDQDQESVDTYALLCDKVKKFQEDNK
ncbi:hypothetical protein UFOVP1365_33 [uncultured Caudovirales phage]|uniref:Uncharacterized protein n=1 Tax=uncultured Caudovirales phage TaxID=2100421 RepID=A0A6J5S4Y4_9CAUD|nr:hypothetical protein UFOVP1365_33 [uncultured Caudovirales phage]